MLGSWIRRKGFWVLDALKGGELAKVLKDIQRVNLEDNRSAQLEYILSYAKQYVPFYQGLNAHGLSDFPVVNKTVFKREGDRCLSTEYPNKEKLHKVSTSGSTGTPLTVYLNKEKRQRVVVDLINAHNNVGWELGDKFIFIRNWVPNYKQSKLKNIFQNVIPISITEFDQSKKEWLTNYLLKHPQTVVFGYASAVCDYMNYITKQNLNKIPAPKLIICDSDELSKSNKNKLESLFNCPVINRYDNEENGLLAITSRESDVFTVNYQSLIIELLELDSDKPVSPGEVGRVVVTDLYNKAMPLIRYDTGDCALSLDPVDRIRHLESLCGRSAVYICSVDGKKISTVGISVVAEVFSGIEKYQIVQNTDNEYIFKYVGMLTEMDLLLLTERLKNTLGNGAIITMVKVDKIESKANGKFATMVNNNTKTVIKNQ